MRHVQLLAFHQVAVHGGFSRAAEAMGLTQPAVSEQIRRLERDYDVLLFQRDRKQPQLTEAGQRLFVLTRQYFEVEERIAEALTESRTAIEGTLRIKADSTFHIAEVLRSYQRLYPRVFVSIRSGNTAEVLADLRSYDAEIGIAGSVDDARDLDLIGMDRTPIVAFAARGYFPAGRSELSFRDLAGETLVMREPGSQTRLKVEEAAARARVRLAPAFEAEGREAVREIVAAGIGVGFVSRAEFGHDARLQSYEIADLAATMKEHVICLSQRRDVRAIAAFMTLAREMAETRVDLLD